MRYVVFLSFLFTVLTSQAQICPLCGIPNNFSIYVTDSQADISWPNISDAIYYDIRFQEDDGNNGIGNNNWIYINNIPNNQYSLTSLLPNTEYEFEVRSYCNSGYSYWSDDEEFETLNIIIYDCNNFPNGSAFIDNCGDCVGGNTNLSACSQDCNGDWGGNAIIDNCGDCVGGNTNLSACSQDCNGDWGGNAIIDNCGDCIGGNTNLSACNQDCNGDWGGNAIIDNCGDCIGGNTNLSACNQDCNGDWGGNAIIDNCGDCIGGNTNLFACSQDCNGDWGGNAIIDNCGNCTLPFENCINFSPNTNTSLTSTICGDTTDLTIMFEQNQYEPDIQNSLFWSDEGTFILQNINLGDTIGYGFLNTDGGNIMISTVFVVSSVISNNQLVLSSIDTITNNNVGNFTIANLNPGIYITATSPGDNNNVTDGNYSMGVFENIFLNPTTPTTIEFTANINSELGDSDIQYEYIDIDCFSNIQTKEYSEIIVYPNPNKGVFNVNTLENTKITVYNLNGKIVFQEILKNGKNLINISLEKGMYFANFCTENNTYNKKIIIH